MEYIMVYITASSLEEAREISSSLLEKRLVACANILQSVESHYHWKGATSLTVEAQVTFKTTKAKFDEVAAEIKRLHSYQVPAIISFDISGGDRDYLNWIAKETEA